MELNPTQTFIIGILPADEELLLHECTIGANNHLCVGLPVTQRELRRTLASLQLLGHCEKRVDLWHRTTPKPKQERSLF